MIRFDTLTVKRHLLGPDMLLRTVLLLLLCATTLALGRTAEYNEAHGIPSIVDHDSRVVGGSTALAGEFPWQVSIQTYETFPKQTCGGSIISTEWVVTAAHCSNINPSSYRVRVGSLNFTTGGSVHSALQVVRHQAYDGLTLENDIAVWKVTPPFTIFSLVRPVELPPQGLQTAPGTLVQISGWGKTSSEAIEVSDLLRKVSVPVVDKATCNQSYINYGGISPNQICAGEDGKGFCLGDEGGPLVLDGVLHGVTSWGLGCAEGGLPGVYTEVAAYRDWIAATTGI